MQPMWRWIKDRAGITGSSGVIAPTNGYRQVEWGQICQSAHTQSQWLMTFAFHFSSAGKNWPKGQEDTSSKTLQHKWDLFSEAMKHESLQPSAVEWGILVYKYMNVLATHTGPNLIDNFTKAQVEPTKKQQQKNFPFSLLQYLSAEVLQYTGGPWPTVGPHCTWL